MLDLNVIDPATVLASPELDALIAGKWMGWKVTQYKSLTAVETPTGLRYRIGGDIHVDTWSPSTNPGYAGEARRKAEASFVVHDGAGLCCEVIIQVNGGKYPAVCGCAETNNDKAKAEALATCRAIVAMLKANNAAGGES